MAEKINKLNFRAWVLTGALLWGLYLFIGALLASAGVYGWWWSKLIWDMIVSIYPGISATAFGVIIALLWGLFCGALCAGIFAGVHNLLAKKLR